MRKAQQNFLNYLGAVERVIQNSLPPELQSSIDLQPVKQLEASIRSKELLLMHHLPTA